MIVRRRPRGYPKELETELTLADGRKVQVRPILPSDADQLRDAIEHADAETLRSRFLGGKPPTDDATIQRLVCVDYVHRLALVALDSDGTGAGIARYEGNDGSDTAEVAVAVDPAWRHVGLATDLLHLLGVAAHARGIRAFTATFFADNRDVHDIIRESGLPKQRFDGVDAIEEVIALDG
jgi:GNAT superfamily N-acetyltransferase